MTGFQHDIAGGGGNLIATSVQSPNFVHGVSGWRIAKDGSAEFQDVILPAGSGGITATFSAAAPASPHAGDLWYDTGNGLEVSQWNGSAWVAFQIGTGAIASGAITASLIAANTITAGQLAAGIVYAGIVDATTITGAQFVAVGSSGEILAYSSTPASGNLIASVSAANGTDAHGNAYLAGSTTYANDGSFWSAISNFGGVITWYKASSEAGPWTVEAGIGFNWNNITGGGLAFSGPAGSSMTGDLNVTGSVTATVTLTVGSTDVGATLSAIISALSGASTSTSGLTNGTISGTSSNAGLTDGTIAGTSGAQSAGTAHTHSHGSYAVNNGQHSHGNGSYAVADGTHHHTLPTV